MMNDEWLTTIIKLASYEKVTYGLLCKKKKKSVWLYMVCFYQMDNCKVDLDMLVWHIEIFVVCSTKQKTQ